MCVFKISETLGSGFELESVKLIGWTQLRAIYLFHEDLRKIFRTDNQYCYLKVKWSQIVGWNYISKNSSLKILLAITYDCLWKIKRYGGNLLSGTLFCPRGGGTPILSRGRGYPIHKTWQEDPLPQLQAWPGTPSPGYRPDWGTTPPPHPRKDMGPDLGPEIGVRQTPVKTLPFRWTTCAVGNYTWESVHEIPLLGDKWS